MGHTRDSNELFEILGYALRSVVGDNAWCGIGEQFSGALQNGLDVEFGHGLADLVVHDVPATAVQDTAEVIESAGDIEVRDIDMPVFVRLARLLEPFPFSGGCHNNRK